MNENLIKGSINTADLKTVNDAIALCMTTLKPYLLDTITKETLDTMQKLGDRSESFVRKCIELAEQEPTLVPSYIQVNDAKEDLLLFDQLRNLESGLKQLQNWVSSNRSLAGAEALDFANDHYASIRFLSKNNHPKAKEAFENLHVRYKNQGRRRPANPTP